MADTREKDGPLSDAAGFLQRFAEVAEQVAATTKKLEKAALVGNYLHQLIDADLGARRSIFRRSTVCPERRAHHKRGRQHY